MRMYVSKAYINCSFYGSLIITKHTFTKNKECRIFEAQPHSIAKPLLLPYIPSDKGVEITHGYQLQKFPH